MPALKHRATRMRQNSEGRRRDKPRGRKPRDILGHVRIGDGLWGFEWWVCLKSG